MNDKRKQAMNGALTDDAQQEIDAAAREANQAACDVGTAASAGVDGRYVSEWRRRFMALSVKFKRLAESYGRRGMAARLGAVEERLATYARWLAAAEQERDAFRARCEAIWSPIDTAPKDGSEVLLAVRLRAGISGRLLVGHWMCGGHCIEDHPAIEAGWYFWNGLMFDRAAEPTHWMPLPLLPAVAKEGAGK